MEKFMRGVMGSGDAEDEGDDEYGNDVTDRKGDNNDGIPFACHICRGPFQNPIVTTCGHYFCESCMLGKIRNEDGGGGTGCPICQKDTHGVLNYAQKLVAKKRRLVGRDGTWEEYLEKMGGQNAADDDD